MKKPVSITYNPGTAKWSIVLDNAEPITDLVEMAGMYNRLVEKYNNLYDELAGYLPYAVSESVTPDPHSRESVSHSQCPRYDAGINGCRDYPCADCDLAFGGPSACTE